MVGGLKDSTELKKAPGETQVFTCTFEATASSVKWTRYYIAQLQFSLIKVGFFRINFSQRIIINNREKIYEGENNQIYHVIV